MTTTKSQAQVLRIVNLTSHKVTLVTDDGRIIREWPKTNNPARFVATTTPVTTTKDGIPITKTLFSDLHGLPPYNPEANTFYIVSQVVKSRLPYRTDLLIPSNILKEDRTGKPLGCRSLGI